MMSVASDLTEIGRQLQVEQLFIVSEREQLMKLYNEVNQTLEHVQCVSMVCHQQKALLKEFQNAFYCSATNNIDLCKVCNDIPETSFVDSYKHLSQHGNKFAELLRFLWKNPLIIAQCIHEGEKAGLPEMEKIITTVSASVYGSCIFKRDEVAVCHILTQLAHLQLTKSNNPRRLLHRGNCSFSILYKQLCDSLYSARLFLTGSLHEPTMRLLMEEEWFYDIDPSKAMDRFPLKDRVKRFGHPASPDYDLRQKQYRQFIVNKLVMLTKSFISSIKANLYCFPSGLTYVVGQVFTSLTATGRFSEHEVRSTCADLIFGLFICPAICDPEPLGITSDIPISHIMRHNLMQVAQIVQVLAMPHCDDMEPKVKDLCSHFSEDSMLSVLDCFLEGIQDDTISSSSDALHSMPVRSTVLLKLPDLLQLVQFVQVASGMLSNELIWKAELEGLLSLLPPDPSVAEKRKQQACGDSSFEKCSENNDLTDDVLVITILPPFEFPGTYSEEKVLSQVDDDGDVMRQMNFLSSPGGTFLYTGHDVFQKRPHFSLSNVQDCIGVEAKCSVSDTWSTDVIASDCEPTDHHQADHLAGVAEENVPTRFPLPDLSDRRNFSLLVPEISETANDACSADVLASDVEEKNSERLRGLDSQDYLCNVAVRDGSLNSDGAQYDGAQYPNPGICAMQYGMKTGDVGGGITSENDAVRLTATQLMAAGRHDEGPCGAIPASQHTLPHAAVSSLLNFQHFTSHASRCEDRQHLQVCRHEQSTSRHDIEIFEKEDKQVHCSSFPSLCLANLESSQPDSTNTVQNNPLVMMAMPTVLLDVGKLKSCYDTGESCDLSTNCNEYISFNCSLAETDVRNCVETQNPINAAGKVFGHPALQPRGSPLLSENDNTLLLLEQQNISVEEKRLSTALRTLDLSRSDVQSGIFFDNGNRQYAGHAPVPLSVPDLMLDDASLDIASTPVGRVLEVIGKDSSLYKGINGSDDFGTAEKKCVALPRKLSFADSLPSRLEADAHVYSPSSVQSTGRQMFSKAAVQQVRNSDGIIVKQSSVPELFEADCCGKKPASGFLKTFRDKLHKAGMKKRSTKLGKEIIESAMQTSSNSDNNGNGSIDYGESVDKSDMILAKYRTQESIEKSTTSRNAIKASVSQQESAKTDDYGGDDVEEDDDSVQIPDEDKLEQCFAFHDAKRKLRLVLGSCKLMPRLSKLSIPPSLPRVPVEHELVCLLRLQLAEAVNLHNRDLAARLHEAVRCVKLFDDNGCTRLIRSLGEDRIQRAKYISYLVKCHQDLLSTLSHLHTLQRRADREKEIIAGHVVTVNVRIFIQHWEKQVLHFVSHFQRLTIQDEKSYSVQMFMCRIFDEMAHDRLWKSASSHQLELGKAAVERIIMSHIYSHAIFPNVDGDIQRDQILQQHIHNLRQSLTPTHKDLRIPRTYHFECPWPAAQHEISMINAFKMPKDKSRCVTSCCQTIMSLLGVANERAVPAADDLMPVLIFVIIMANPPCLLSTVQYVDSFYSNRMQGEEQYWWMQFSSAVEFIKTMDY